MELPFRFQTSERGWPAFIILAVGSGMILAAIVHGPPPALWWLPVGGTTAFALWMIVANRRHGIELSAEALTVVCAGRARSWPLAAIDHLEVQDWSDGTSYVLHLRDGGTEWLFSGAFPGRTRLAAAAAGVGLVLRVT